jgi:hypothetical protein
MGTTLRFTPSHSRNVSRMHSATATYICTRPGDATDQEAAELDTGDDDHGPKHDGKTGDKVGRARHWRRKKATRKFRQYDVVFETFAKFSGSPG